MGDKIDLFRELRTDKIRKELEELETSVPFAPNDPDLRVECGDILDMICVVNTCCRKSMTTHMRFIDLY